MTDMAVHQTEEVVVGRHSRPWWEEGAIEEPCGRPWRLSPEGCPALAPWIARSIGGHNLLDHSWKLAAELEVGHIRNIDPYLKLDQMLAHAIGSHLGTAAACCRKLE